MDKIAVAAYDGNVHTLQELTSSSVDVTGIIDDDVSMCVTIQYTVYYLIV